MNKIVAVVVLVVVVVAGWLLLRNKSAVAPTNTETFSEVVENTGVDQFGTQAATTSPESKVKEFTVTGGSFYFSPKTLSVNKGDTVQINFVNAGGFHDFVLDEFNVKTARTNGGDTATVTFVADKSGTFEYYCSIGTHRQMGMKGTLTVN